jgi:hypothetical protein
MAEWLLRSFPTPVLVVLVLGGVTLLAVVGVLLFRRYASHLIEASDNDVAGVIVSILAGIYGIVVAFVIVVLWEDYRAAQEIVATEASAVARVVQDSQAFPAPTRLVVSEAAKQYVHTVVQDEWDTMSQGQQSPLTQFSLDGLYRALREYEPNGATETGFYQEASSNLEQVDTSRRERLRMSQRQLPNVLQVLIVGGAALIILFTYFFGVESTTIHVLMTAGVALLIGFSLLLSLLLQSPFSGDISVDNSVFREGVLAQFWR